jgi:hypothetical protein
VDLRELVEMAHTRVSGVVLNALVYYVTGLVVLSEAHFATLRAKWQRQGLVVPRLLGRRWALLLLGLVAGIGGASVLLPVGYSVGILEALGLVVRGIARAIVFVYLLFLSGLSLILQLVRDLVTGLVGEVRRPTPMPPASPTPVATPTPIPLAEPAGGVMLRVPWWELVRSVLFWFVFVGIVGYAVVHFVEDRWGLMQRLKGVRWFSWLSEAWRRWRHRGGTVAARMRAAISQRRLSRTQRREERVARRISLRRLSPRERVRYYYLSILHRSARQGLERKAHSTPYEYESVLTEAMPNASAEVRNLTEAFVEARYGAHEIDDASEAAARSWWLRLRRALRESR